MQEANGKAGLQSASGKKQASANTETKHQTAAGAVRWQAGGPPERHARACLMMAQGRLCPFLADYECCFSKNYERNFM